MFGGCAAPCGAPRGQSLHEEMSLPNEIPPFPVLLDEQVLAWKWPGVPFEWAHVAMPEPGVAQACRIETPTGSVVEGFFLGMDPGAATISFRSGPDGAALSLPFARLRKLVLTVPLRAAAPMGGGIPERVPTASQQHEYWVRLKQGGSLEGRTLGVVDAPEGFYFFEPLDDDWSLQRSFVPRLVAARVEVGPTAQDLAAEHWAATPQQLMDALDRQRRMPVLPLGQSLLQLGLVTQDQLDRALALPGDEPLGERLVRARVITAGDLETAIAHKMGYPVVDLTRFPIEREAVRRLPIRMALKHRALPLMIQGDRLIVCVDRPSRLAQLEKLYALAGFKLVGVLASKGQILLALSGLADEDLWNDGVSIRAGFFAQSGT